MFSSVSTDQLAARLLYDPESGIIRWQHKKVGKRLVSWNARYAGQPAGTSRVDGYIQINLDGHYYPAHRLAWQMHHGFIDPSLDIDHRNGDRSDNRIVNLRQASRSQNLQNKRARGGKWPKNIMQSSSGRFYARVEKEGRVYRSGPFIQLQDAVQQSVILREHHHGTFARHD